MNDVQVYLFGPPRVEHEGELVPVNRRKMLALLAYLLVTLQPHSREALATLFWPDFDTSSALANLRRDLSRLKEILGEQFLMIEREKIQANPEATLWVDVNRFEICLRQAEEHGHFRPGNAEAAYCAHCQQLLLQAAQAYTDDFLAGFNLPDSSAFDEWQFLQAERLRSLLAGVLDHLAQWCVRQGAFDEATEYVRRWLALDPLHEPAQRLAMRAYFWAGQPSAALRQYQVLVDLLKKELGVEPEEETTALYEAVRTRRVPPPPHLEAALEQTTSGAAHTDLPLEESATSAGRTPIRWINLPTQTTPLIGRELELAQLSDLFNNIHCRLVTLVGTGGIGKTRLAAETASRLIESFANGVIFVPLAPVSEVGFILTSIANALQMRFSPGLDPKDQLVQYLQGLEMLLVLDNFEHLLDGAVWLTEILAAAPGIRLLITSRERLNLLEEWVFEVGGLPFPPPGEPVTDPQRFSAVQLFIERARRALPSFQADAETLFEISRICQLVEGMPLALELAVPWVRAMTPREIAQELEHGLDLLNTSMRNLPDRHRSVRLVFDQSWETLTPAEMAVLSKLSVFHNGCTREAAEKVAGANPTSLMTLVDKALLRHRGDRYEMHELVRQYAAERLREDGKSEETTRDRHYRYYLDLVAQIKPWLKGGRQLEGSHKITQDIDNIRTAWHRAVLRHDSLVIAQAAETYWLYHEFGGYLAQGEAAFTEAAEAFLPDRAEQTLAGFLRAGQGSLLGRQWQLAQGLEIMKEGLALLRESDSPDPEMIAFAIAWYAFLNVISGQLQEASRAAQESLSYFPQTGDQWTRAGALRLSGAAMLYQGQIQSAQEYLNQCVEVCKSIGELRIRTYATSNLGIIHLWYGQLDQARQYFEESLRVSLSCNDRLSRADALLEYSRLFLASGEFDRAEEMTQISKQINYEMGRKNVILANILLGRALLSKDPIRAEEVLMEGLATARAVNQKPDIAAGLEGLGILAIHQKAYDRAQEYFRESLQIWTSIGNEPEIATLACRSAHGLLASGSSDFPRIRELLGQALRLAVKHQAATVAITAMVGLATLRIRSGELTAGDAEKVTKLLRFVRQHPAAPREARTWAEDLLEQVPADPSQPEDSSFRDISWQSLADDWQRQLSFA